MENGGLTAKERRDRVSPKKAALWTWRGGVPKVSKHVR